MSKSHEPNELGRALEALSVVPELNERQRIELLIDTQAGLNNGDAMAYFGRWLEAVCDAIGIELEPFDPSLNPFD